MIDVHFALTPADLRSWAAHLRHSASDTATTHQDATDELSFLRSTGFDGLVATTAVQGMSAIIERLTSPQARMSRAATILDITASLQEELDRALNLVIAVASTHTAYSPAVTSMLFYLQSMGEVLDRTCAHHITMLCTPELADPPRSWEDLPDAELGVIHEINLLHADEHVRQLTAANPDLQLLELPDGGLVAAIGDLTSADTVTTYVAGVGSSDPASWPGHVSTTRALIQASGPQAAGVVWLGYRAPASVVAGINPSASRAGGSALAGFQKELARRFPDQHRVVVGHSYGTVVVGQAATDDAGGLAADDVILVGSPGVGARSASELVIHSDDPRVHAVTVRGDPIALATGPVFGVHGPDPTHPFFGARRWGVLASELGDHGWYFTNPEFLAEFSAQIGGRTA